MTLSHPPLSAERTSDGPVGIGGWLILPIIGLGGTILATGYVLFSGLSEWDGVKAMIAGSNPTAVALRFPLGLMMLLGFMTMVFAATCLYRIFTLSPRVPGLMTAYYITLVIVTLLQAFLGKLVSDILGTAPDSGIFTDILRVVVGAAIWIPYFNTSKRVANTFRDPETD